MTANNGPNYTQILRVNKDMRSPKTLQGVVFARKTCAVTERELGPVGGAVSCGGALRSL